jgi:hypothetical protein
LVSSGGPLQQNERELDRSVTACQFPTYRRADPISSSIDEGGRHGGRVTTVRPTIPKSGGGDRFQLRILIAMQGQHARLRSR